MSADKAVGIYISGDSDSRAEAAALEQFARDRDLNQIRTYIEWVGSEDHRRPALAALLDDVRLGRIDTVLLTKLATLGTLCSVVRAGELMRQFDVALLTLDGLDTTKSIGRLFFAHVALLANVEREMSRVRQRTDSTNRSVIKEQPLLSPEGLR